VSRTIQSIMRLNLLPRPWLDFLGSPFRAAYLSEKKRFDDLLCLVDQIHALVRLNVPLHTGLRQCAAEYGKNKIHRGWQIGPAVVFFIVFLVLGWTPLSYLRYEELILVVVGYIGLGFLLALLIYRLFSQQSTPRRRARMFSRLAERLENGAELSEALAAMPRLVPGYVVDLVRAGELGGELSPMLDRLRSSLSHDKVIRQSARAASLYLGLLTLVIVQLSIFATIKVIPVFIEVLNEYEYPVEGAMSRIVVLGFWLRELSMSMQYGDIRIIVPVVVMIITVLWLGVMLRWWRPGNLLTRLFMSIPPLAVFYRQRMGAQVCAVLGPLLGAGIPLPIALAQVAAMDLPGSVRRSLARVQAQVEGGAPLNVALRAEGRQSFPPSLPDFVALGEQCDALPDAVDYLAQMYTGEVQRRQQMMSAFIVPCGILILGCIVLFVQLTVFTSLTGVSDALFYSL